MNNVKFVLIAWRKVKGKTAIAELIGQWEVYRQMHEPVKVASPYKRIYHRDNGFLDGLKYILYDPETGKGKYVFGNSKDDSQNWFSLGGEKRYINDGIWILKEDRD